MQDLERLDAQVQAQLAKAEARLAERKAIAVMERKQAEDRIRLRETARVRSVRELRLNGLM